jgi:hypothetical protein
MYVLQMTMVEIIHMLSMLNSGVAATWAVDVWIFPGRSID